MVFIKILGADQFIALQNVTLIEQAIRQHLDLKDEINFICPDSYFVHGDQEQTSFQCLVEVLAPAPLKAHRAEMIQGITEGLKNLTVHGHIIFSWFDPEDEIDIIDSDYPDYMTPDNMVKTIDSEPEPTSDDSAAQVDDSNIYTGNIFQELDDFVAAHPEMNKDQATLAYYESKRKAKK